MYDRISEVGCCLVTPPQAPPRLAPPLPIHQLPHPKQVILTAKRSLQQRRSIHLWMHPPLAEVLAGLMPANPTSSTYEVRISDHNPSRKLRPGLPRTYRKFSRHLHYESFVVPTHRERPGRSAGSSAGVPTNSVGTLWTMSWRDRPKNRLMYQRGRRKLPQMWSAEFCPPTGSSTALQLSGLD